jgi:hypothetical protein
MAGKLLGIIEPTTTPFAADGEFQAAALDGLGTARAAAA